jgi:hypothetical protein
MIEPGDIQIANPITVTIAGRSPSAVSVFAMRGFGVHDG